MESCFYLQPSNGQTSNPEQLSILTLYVSMQGQHKNELFMAPTNP